jgi:hypothetical protein
MPGQFRDRVPLDGRQGRGAGEVLAGAGGAVVVSSKDVDRVEKGIRSGDPRYKVFPRLSDMATTVDGEGLTVTAHFTKKQGVPVHYVADDSTPPARSCRSTCRRSTT